MLRIVHVKIKTIGLVCMIWRVRRKKNDVLLYRNKFKVSISANLNVLKIDGEKRKPNTIIKVVLKSLIVSSGATKREHSKVIYSHIDFFLFRHCLRPMDSGWYSTCCVYYYYYHYLECAFTLQEENKRKHHLVHLPEILFIECALYYLNFSFLP